MYSDSELELVGAIIGDGHIHKKQSKYYFGLTGNKVTDKAYFAKLATLIRIVWNKDTKVFESGRGLRIRVYSKEIVNRLITEFSLPFNKGKCYVVRIPKQISSNFSQSRHILRGIVDTDGSVFVSKKPGIEKYPSLEITTVSKNLAKDVWNILNSNGFRVANIRSYTPKNSGAICYKVGLYGRVNLRKWVNEIGFSNPIKHLKAISSI